MIRQTVCFGHTIEPENEADFNAKLSTLLDDETLYKKCQEGCRVLSIDFDRKKYARKMLDVIEQTVQ